MKKLFALFAAALFIYSISFANIRRLGYTGIPRAGVDYADFASAHTASAAGDTIQIYPGFNSSGTLTKQLVIMGFGYNFDVNPNLQAIGMNTPSQANLTFNPGSANSIVEGIEGTMNIYTTNITIRRSMVTVNLYTSATNSGNDIRIESCALYYFTGSNNAYPSLNTQIYNCIFYGITFYNTSSTGSIINCVTSSPNYATGYVNLNSASVLVKNSILPFNPANTNTVWENNFFNTAIPGTLPPGGNNRWSQSWATLFNRMGGTLESPSYIFATDFDEDYYTLKAASPAINGGFDAGNNPTDCGIYGGELLYRYKLSGVPAVPAIYKLTAPGPAATSNPYNVTISVRSNN